jgi:hypothetical protein
VLVALIGDQAMGDPLLEEQSKALVAKPNFDAQSGAKRLN